MKIEKLVLIAGMLGFLTACADKETDSAAGTEPQPPTAETAAPPAAPETDSPFDREAFLNHMHVHSIHLERINEALAAGDLEAVETPAYWLSTHDAVDGLPRGWGQYLVAIRDEAYTIQKSTDVTSAKAAAERLAGHCRDCHVANGFDDIVL